MIEVALVQISKKHTEIFGTFIEIICKRFKWNLTIYYDLDNYTFVPFYLKLFNVNVAIKHPNELKNNLKKHDLFIFTTNKDKIDGIFKTKEYQKKCLYVSHQSHHWKNYMQKNVSVSPLIKLKNVENKYILPIYRRYQENHVSYQNRALGIIGAIRLNNKDKDINLLIDLIKNQENEIYIFMREKDWKHISSKYQILKTSPKVKFYPGLTTEELVEKLKEVKYLLPLAKKGGWFHWQRLTGTIPLAINLNIPLILDKKVARIYGLNKCGLIYKDSPMEIIDYINNPGLDKYEEMIDRIREYKKEVYQDNSKNLLKLIVKDNLEILEKIDLK